MFGDVERIRKKKNIGFNLFSRFIPFPSLFFIALMKLCNPRKKNNNNVVVHH